MLLITNRKEELPRKQNVVLFPKTYQYYQMELTRLLESERYAEATDLLEFLLQFEGEDEEIRREWQSLRDWLQLVFPELKHRQGETDEEFIHNEMEALEDEGESEQQLLQHKVAEKQKLDSRYVNRLLDSLQEPPLDEKKLLILEQLANVNDEKLNNKLVNMLEQKTLYPLIQFGLLQTLHRREASGTVIFTRLGEQVKVQIEDTPMDYMSFSAVLRAPASFVHEVSALSEPSVAYFAQEMWHQFLKITYGTALYNRMVNGDELDTKIWAAALHVLVASYLRLEETESEVTKVYALEDVDQRRYEQAFSELTKSFRNV